MADAKRKVPMALRRGETKVKARHAAWWAASLLLVSFAHVVAAAEEQHISSVDDLCPPSADPCVISENVTIDPPGDLDFGLRNIVVLKGARIRAERASILCGSFWLVGPDNRTGVLIPDTDAYASFSVTARRGCSLSPSKPCFDDTECASGGLGTCSFGQGAITLEAAIDGNRRYGPDVVLRAANDIVVGSSIVLNGTGAEGSAGSLTLQSFTGDVLIAATVKLKPAPPQGDSGNTGQAGELTILAERDADVSAFVDMSGAASDSTMNLNAGRDLRISHNMSRDASDGTYPGDGGPAWMYAGRDLVVEPHGSADDVTYVTSNGGRQFIHSWYANYWLGGDGGYTRIDAGRALIVARKATLQANSPGNACDGEEGWPEGGEFRIYTGKSFSLNGPIVARASGCFGGGGVVQLRTGGDATVEPHGIVDVTGTAAGIAYLYAWGNLDIKGKLDTSAEPLMSYYSEDRSQGGYASLYGDDVTVSGEVLLGGGEYGSDFSAWSCRLRVESTGLIDNRCSPNGACWARASSRFSVRQNMIAESGSRIFAESDSAPMTVVYGDSNQPPVLSGIFEPPPILEYVASSGDSWCASCGNGEIDNDETCDDWNITDGDGCSATCVNEHCIADTPGYPATPLCDDASACTNDRCDPLAGVCLHEPACADEIECTQEACDDEACVVSAVDALCDDLDPCTADLCNTLTGCVHAALVAVACDDNDVCTAASACEDSAGCVAPDPRPALGGHMTISAHAAGRDDVLVAKFDVTAAEILAPITESGVAVRLVDDAGNILIDTYLPGALFSGHESPAFDYRFDDPGGSIAEAEGVTLLRVRKKSPTRAVVQLRIRRPDLDAANTASAFGLSVVFGPDPEIGGCATLELNSCRAGKKIACRG